MKQMEINVKIESLSYQLYTTFSLSRIIYYIPSFQLECYTKRLNGQLLTNALFIDQEVRGYQSILSY